MRSPAVHCRPFDATIETRRSSGLVVVEVRGELNLFSAPRLKSTMRDVMGTGPRAVAIDLREVSFVDSAGLGVLVSALRAARSSGCSLSLSCERRSFLRRVLEQTRLSRVFEIVEEPPVAYLATA